MADLRWCKRCDRPIYSYTREPHACPPVWPVWVPDSARLRAAEAELERLRGALRGMLATHDQSHSEECNAWTARDEDVCRCEAGCPEPHCDCGSTEARNAARAALGEP